MKKYLIFKGTNYYPGGGWDDFIGAVDTLREAHAVLSMNRDDWWQIVNTETLRVERCHWENGKRVTLNDLEKSL